MDSFVVGQFEFPKALFRAEFDALDQILCEFGRIEGDHEFRIEQLGAWIEVQRADHDVASIHEKELGVEKGVVVKVFELWIILIAF